jgi:hypothetical protein
MKNPILTSLYGESINIMLMVKLSVVVPVGATLALNFIASFCGL